MKRVLWISYLYPPLWCGVGRQVKVAKYLPRYGWEPFVLTVKKSLLHPFVDESRMKDIPPETLVYRTSTLETRLTYLPVLLHLNPKWIRIPDQFAGWYPFAVKEGLRIVREHRIDAIFSTSLPNTCHLVGLALKRKTGLPWVADFRDPWIRNVHIIAPRPVLAIERRMEAAVIHHADRVTAIDEPITEEFRSAYPHEPKTKFIGIPHGFDPEDFAHFQRDRRPSGEKFRLAFAGTIHDQDRGVSLAYVIKELLDGDGELARQLQVSFVGTMKPLERLCSRLDLGPAVNFLGMLPHEDAWSILADSDVLLFILGPQQIHEKVPCGKLAEYLAMAKPTLALIPQGIAADILRKANIALIVDPDDKQGIKQAILNLYGKWQSGELRVDPNREFIEQYDIRRLTARFAGILDELVGMWGRCGV